MTLGQSHDVRRIPALRPSLCIGLLKILISALASSLRVFIGVTFAMIGGVLALYLCDIPVSLSAGSGFIALFGISVLADFFMVNSIRHFIESGVPVREAAFRAALQRLLPVLMTALVASLGLIPMATNTRVEAEVQRPLATVAIGGIVSSTLFMLFVHPALYVALRKRRS